jgi:hypothetical protein
MPAAVHSLGRRTAAFVVQVRVSEAGLRSVQLGTLRLLRDLLETVVVHDGIESLPGAGIAGGNGDPGGAAFRGGAADACKSGGAGERREAALNQERGLKRRTRRRT